MVTFRKIELPIAGIEELQAEARAESYSFLDRLVADWSGGENRFDGPGEILLGGFAEGSLVAVGGLNRDPFLRDPAVGRIRRVYVRAGWRSQGVGRGLVTALLEHARLRFTSVRLRAENEGAARLYERLGFVRIDDSRATHWLHLKVPPAGTGAGSGA
jgi:GNAT superfamily N-acetyltransferase